MENGEGGISRSTMLQPDEIEDRSFSVIRGLLPNLSAGELEMPILLRIVHTTGDPGIVEYVRIHHDAVASGLQAIRRKAPILTDVKMVASGINKRLAERFGCSVVCAIDDPEVITTAKRSQSTRAAAAMRSFMDRLDGSIVAIGNAPTALFALIDLIDDGKQPALVIGTPVGFVGAAESKIELMKRDIPYITVEGTRGGSAISAAVVNALFKLEV